jgi:hypothetical protein
MNDHGRSGTLAVDLPADRSRAENHVQVADLHLPHVGRDAGTANQRLSGSICVARASTDSAGSARRTAEV